MNRQIQMINTRQNKLVSILTTVVTAAALATVLAASTAHAGNSNNFTDHARVVHVEPVYRYVTVKVPKKVCRPYNQNHHNGHATHNNHHNNSNSPVFVSGAIVGAIGQELGRGRAVTQVDRSHNQRRPNRNQQRNNSQRKRGKHCTTIIETRRERHNDGYHVTYIYQGRSFNTRTPHHPGNRIAVRVAVSTY